MFYDDQRSVYDDSVAIWEVLRNADAVRLAAIGRLFMKPDPHLNPTSGWSWIGRDQGLIYIPAFRLPGSDGYELCLLLAKYGFSIKHYTPRRGNRIQPPYNDYVVVQHPLVNIANSPASLKEVFTRNDPYDFLLKYP
jgi:hypothetical protein